MLRNWGLVYHLGSKGPNAIQTDHLGWKYYRNWKNREVSGEEQGITVERADMLDFILYLEKPTEPCRSTAHGYASVQWDPPRSEVYSAPGSSTGPCGRLFSRCFFLSGMKFVLFLQMHSGTWDHIVRMQVPTVSEGKRKVWVINYNFPGLHLWQCQSEGWK